MRPRILQLAVVSLALGPLAPAVLPAQSRPAGEPAQERPRPVATAEPRSGPVRLDGHLDEAAWAAATPATEFTQQRPSEGAPASERTEVRFLYDEHALYIGARMYDSLGAAGVTSRLVRRDQDPQSDFLRIDFDPYRDRLYSVEFDVNPAGWRGDAAGNDGSWDPVWEAATQVDSLGWTAEIRIPFSQLRFSRDPVQTWGLNLTRFIHRKQERALWSFWGQKEPGGPAFFGELAGMRIHGRPQHVELLPYAVARTERLSSGDPRSPFYDPASSGLRVGGDLKYLVTSNLTLSATANPDFGQVEVDPAVVNLSAFETFFPERRPFFVEGSDLFRFGQPGCNINCGLGLSLFYSRRVGRRPQGAGLAFAAGPYADVPENAAILGAAKLTGRTAGGYTVGLLNAVTRREVAEVETGDGERLLQPVEPLTNSFVGRVRREMRGGSLVLGGILTSVNRDLDDRGLTSLLPGSAQTAGVDGEYFWGRRTYRLYAAVAASRLAGDSAALLRVQRSSARYLQRPDRDPASNGLFSYAYDPSATSFNGYGAIARVAKQGGSWLWDLNAASVSPGFETNDMGFQTSADWRWLNGTLGRQFTKPTRYYRNFAIMGGAEQQWNYDGDVTGRDVSLSTRAELRNYWNASLFLLRYFPTLSDRLTRGGPVLRQPGSTGAFLSLGTDSRRPVVVRTSFTGFANDDGGSSASGSLNATLRPASNVSLTLGPAYSRVRSTAQYVTSVADPTATAFFGRRYVFAHLDQAQLSLTTRASVTFRPNLSLELFAQPLLASADFHDFEEFAAPRRAEKLVYGRDVGTVEATTVDGATRYVVDPDAAGPARSFTLRDPDFNLRSLRGTGVLRWEWRPGSTAFLVWTQTRSERATLGDFDFGRDRAALFDAPADNIFLLKVSYWLGM
ncbi:MAG TPA: DUF5916 domain-containing protein [Longimicrobiaceae bacterium]|nr:DUF5916 domain-containing protein [Longimicrobiaceae bacterium]